MQHFLDLLLFIPLCNSCINKICISDPQNRLKRLNEFRLTQTKLYRRRISFSNKNYYLISTTVADKKKTYNIVSATPFNEEKLNSPFPFSIWKHFNKLMCTQSSIQFPSISFHYIYIFFSSFNLCNREINWKLLKNLTNSVETSRNCVHFFLSFYNY